MSARITIDNGEATSEKLLDGPVFTMGRETGNDLVINDARASRNHAAIRMQGDKAYYLWDLGSSNGTLLNGRRVSLPSQLKHGDEIVIANHRVSFLQEEGDANADGGAPMGEMQTLVDMQSSTVTVLVVDIRNYTRLSESIPEMELSKLIGKWFQEAGLVIEKHGGSINKFMGDAVMAIWLKTATQTDMNYVHGPVKTATELIYLSRLFHQQMVANFPEHHFEIGCGINTGKAVLGNVGVRNTPDITVIGDSVNIAFRLEKLCKELQRSVIVSADVRKACADAFTFEDLGPQPIKGKAQSLKVFAVQIDG